MRKGRGYMASTDMSIRIDSKLKEQAEAILNQLGLTLTGSINTFLSQIVRDKAIPLSLPLSFERSLYADLLNAKVNREQGVQGISAEEVLTKMDRVIDGVESGG